MLLSTEHELKSLEKKTIIRSTMAKSRNFFFQEGNKSVYIYKLLEGVGDFL